MSVKFSAIFMLCIAACITSVISSITRNDRALGLSVLFLILEAGAWFI